jgi:hypothetical protein
MLIQVTYVDDTKVLVNLGQVLKVIDLGGTNRAPRSRIEFANAGDPLHVKETLDQILSKQNPRP